MLGLGTLAASALGGVGSLLSKGLQYYTDHQQELMKAEQDKRDKEHELKVLGLQYEAAAVAEKEKKEAVIATAQSNVEISNHDLDGKIQGYIAQLSMSQDSFISRLNGGIRPILTVISNMVFFYLLYKTLNYAVAKDITPIELCKLPVVVAFLDMFALMTTFWFTDRSMKRKE